jgi:hypothetical protein
MTVHLSVWVWPAAFIVWVLGVGLGLWTGLGWARDRAYEEGYGDGTADERSLSRSLAKQAAGVAVVKRAGMLAWAQTHPAELEPLPVSPAGYLRGLDRILAGATTNLPRDPDDPYDPDEDAPFTVREEWSVPLEYPPAGETFYAYEPWSLSEGTTLLEDVLAMCANADAAPSVRWLAALEAGQ